LKTPKTTYLSLGRIFIPGRFRVLGGLAFLWPWIGLTRSLWCFLGVFGQNGLKMGFLGEK
jgi:hypothetical protein